VLDGSQQIVVPGVRVDAVDLRGVPAGAVADRRGTLPIHADGAGGGIRGGDLLCAGTYAGADHGALSSGRSAHSHGRFAGLHARFEAAFERMRQRYLRMLRWTLQEASTVFILFAVLIASSAGAAWFVGWDFFPAVDAGQIRLHVNAPIGTRLERTGEIFSAVEEQNPQSDPAARSRRHHRQHRHPALDQSRLQRQRHHHLGRRRDPGLAQAEHTTRTAEYVRRLREILAQKFPECGFYFQPGDMMNQILNFGLPAPIDVKVVGGDYKNYKLAKEMEARLKHVPGAADVHVHQIMNQPALRLEVDRTRAAELGVTQQEVAQNFLISSSSSVVVTPNYWNDPKTGRPYQVVVVQPHHTALDSVEAVLNIPLPGRGAGVTQTLGNVASLKYSQLPAIVNHVNTEPCVRCLRQRTGTRPRRRCR
jgi:multidrug efflux pump subunit AcrB